MKKFASLFLASVFAVSAFAAPVVQDSSTHKTMKHHKKHHKMAKMKDTSSKM